MSNHTVRAAVEGMPKITAQTKFRDLSFTASKRGSISNWNVKATDDYGADCTIGRRLALEYLAFEATRRQGDCPNYLNLMVEGMPRHLTGIEVGFFTLVTYAIRDGVANAQRVSAYWDECEGRRAAASASVVGAVR